MIEVKLKEQELISHPTCYAILHKEYYEFQDMMDDPIAFQATNDPDATHCYEAMRQYNQVEFIKAMVKEAEDHVKNNYWELAPTNDVLVGPKVLDSSCSTKL